MASSLYRFKTCSLAIALFAGVSAGTAIADTIVVESDFGSRGELYNNSGLSSPLNQGDTVPVTLPTHAEEVNSGTLSSDGNSV